MSAFYILTALYFITPAILAVASNKAESLRLIEKNKLFKLSENAKSTKNLLSLTIWLSLYIAVLATGYKFFTGAPYRGVALTAFTITTISSVTLSFVYFKGFTIYKNISFLANITLAYITLWVTWYCGTIASEYISRKTGLSATEMPSGVAGLTLLYTPVLWGVIMVYAFLILYIIAGIVFTLKNPPKKIKNLTPSEKLNHSQSVFISLSLFCGLAFCTTFVASIVIETPRSELFKKIEMNILYTSGYPLTTNTCSPEAPKEPNRRYAILTSGKLAIAEKKTETKYLYSVTDCRQ
ncbi:hypothetical protein [Pseudomonas aeruginosa]|uniref:hypothetical protein n=1 Tax=Pseudomonas aeruginosa TaxID=287 RepID=UPI000F5258F2|nr:hypothetical protein [Pseudomonas aeruginosa]MBO3611303.1 hypothetical protein [Pseudomonas aeruginosa]MBO3616909.1 hypothetical protein [Pseudomonas aeruginosa]MBO3624954.1 hypothetical protein [Pseudomonas aeruginosa]MBO3630813.1 hypothetical protein [Pseudomonas aeruginosa]MCO2407386.1 hypothetical protein [Pseudomonas aeruginosa]